jgi:capsular polysaccharide biosynthesis protein
LSDAKPNANRAGQNSPAAIARREYADSSEDEVSLAQIIQTLREHLWIVMLLPLLFAGLTLGVNFMQTPTYEASTKLLIGEDRGFSDDPAETPNLQALTPTVVEVIRSRPVAESVIAQQRLQMTPDTLLKNLNVQPIPGTQIIRVAYRDASPQTAQQVANAVGAASSKELEELQSKDVVTAVTIERAVTGYRVGPHTLRNGLLGLLLGLMCGIGLALLLGYLVDSRVGQRK